MPNVAVNLVVLVQAFPRMAARVRLRWQGWGEEGVRIALGKTCHLQDISIRKSDLKELTAGASTNFRKLNLS